MSKVIPIYFTSGKIEFWSRQKLIDYIDNRVKEGHPDDIADMFVFQREKFVETLKLIRSGKSYD